MGGVRAFGVALERLLSARSLPFDQPALRPKPTVKPKHDLLQPSFKSRAIRIRSIALRAPSFCLSWVQLLATVL